MSHLDPQHLLIVGTFAAVILVIAANLLDMTVAALLGIGVLTATGNVHAEDVLHAVGSGGGSLALLFGGMAVARMLVPTGIFDLMGALFLRFTRGDGRRLLVGLFILVAPVCAVLPNATTVILLAPVIVRVCQAMAIDFAAPLILMSLISNSAGMLTLVGDPATFLIGTAIGYDFAGYLREVSAGGVLALLAILPLLPRLVPHVWSVRGALPPPAPLPRIHRPAFFAAALVVLTGMVALFMVGEALPNPIVPPEAAIIGAALALLLLQLTQDEPVANVIQDIDWKTLLFLACIFTMVEVLARTGVFGALSEALFAAFGSNTLLVGLAMLGGVGVLSGVLANIPVAVAMTAVLKGWFVVAQLMPEESLGAHFGAWPHFAAPAFVAMMFGATLGGNATMIGASANIVAAGISARFGKPISFIGFMRLGLPITLAQLLVGAGYSTLLWVFLHKQ